MIFKGNLVDLHRREIYPAEVITEGKYIKNIRKINENLDNYIICGFIDAHIHIESSMLIPSEFSKIAVKHGTIAVVSDPHEIANVLGLDGIYFMIDDAKKTPMKFYFGASSCVPATPFETSGAELGKEEIEELLKREEIKYLSEVMNYPAVINRDKSIMEKIEIAKKYNKKIDGHAPMLRGKDLEKYISAGITTDHETISYEEGKEKIQKGMKVIIREGSAAKNFDELIPLIKDYSDKLMFCSDDRHPDDLVREHINSLVSRAVKLGYDLFDVLKVASINPVEHYELDVGLLREGDKADFIIVEDLRDFKVLKTIIDGEIVFGDGQIKFDTKNENTPNKFYTKEKKAEDFKIYTAKRNIKVIKAIDKELITDWFVYKTNSDYFESDIERDILKLVVVNRYKDTKPAVAFINGFGIKDGAIASSVAHDSHNIVAVGTSDKYLERVINLIIKNKGGIALVSKDDEIILPLKVAGLMSNENGEKVAKLYEKLNKTAKEKLGSKLTSPFMTLSFMALLVIPKLKLSDKGLFDGEKFKFTSLFV